jgi:FkbM family methyltransferase
LSLKRWVWRLYRRVTGELVPEHARVSFAQEGEDLLLEILLDRLRGPGTTAPGFYVDVGAHDPVRFSNTQLFYLRGWRGINIDPRLGFQARLDQCRPGDINLNIAIGRERATQSYFEFNEPALNSFEPELARSRDGVGGYRIESTRPVEVYPLAEVLRRHVPVGQEVTFFTVDVEGLDLDVLMSNDWNLCRPLVIVVELSGDPDLEDLATHPIATYLKSVGYKPLAKLRLSAVFGRI